MQQKKIIIIGGGASGYFTAVNIAMQCPTAHITILEKTNKVLSKVKISGGGRCNVTHHCFEVNELIKQYPRGGHFLKKCLYQFSTSDTVAWYAKQGVALHTESDGRMFPTTNSSDTIINCLTSLCKQYGVQVMMQAGVSSFVPNATGYTVTTTNGGSMQCTHLVIATGGYPKLDQYNWLQQSIAQLPVVQPVPSLFTCNIPKHSITELMGVSVPNAQVKIQGTKLAQAGPVLITHWGLSGPAVLKLSAYAAIELAKLNYHYTITVNWAYPHNETTLLQQWKLLTTTTQTVANSNPLGLPNRLWLYLLAQCGIPATIRWAAVGKDKQNALIKILTTHTLTVQGKTTYKEEFVTSGGISVDCINPATMEHKHVPKVYCVGEVLNVDGITGGFNFQHAWSSGYIAAQAIVHS